MYQLVNKWMLKIEGAASRHNVADIGTKNLDGAKLNFLRKAVGYTSVEEGLSGEFDRQISKIKGNDQLRSKGSRDPERNWLDCWR